MSLQSCYNIIRKNSNKVDDFNSVNLVEHYRNYWKPEKVNLLLLAESHVHTSQSERSITFGSISELNGYPSNYVKFVYCLAYGEPQLIKHRNQPKRDGTPQFWKLLFSCINQVNNTTTSFRPILKTGTRNFNQRLANKIQLLIDLKKNGVWLVDTSIAAIYGNPNQVSEKEKMSILKTSWDCYVKNLVIQCNPTCIIVIGKRVDSIVASDLTKHFNGRYRTLHQPQARLSSKEQLNNFKKYYTRC